MNILQCSFNAVTILLVARNKLEFKQTPLSYLNAALGSQKKSNKRRSVYRVYPVCIPKPNMAFV